MAQYSTLTDQLLPSNKTIHEVVMLSDKITASGTAGDAFSRFRISNPFTLFDSQNRHFENSKWATSNTASSNTEYKTNESSVYLNVGTGSGNKVIRETTKVFAYQPGKSLLVLNSFVMNEQKTNLRQRVGYFSEQNGVYFENDGTGNYFVLRSFVSGSVVNTRVAQANWNGDKFNGTGYSAQNSGIEYQNGINITKGNILWMDIEWLGVGDVRCGFVVDGKFVIAHTFHNDNVSTAAYMTTACLPLRYEIENTGVTQSASTLKQICSSVISEGGYELYGRPRTVGLQPTPGVSLATAGTYYPLLSIRLNPDYPDSIVVPKHLDILPISASNYRYKIIQNATLTGATWANVSSDSTVQYDSNTLTIISGGVDLHSAYITSTNQAKGTVSFADSIFRFQLERNRLANTTTPLTIAITSSTNSCNCAGSLSWEEVV
jgi:hypothetical protein